MASALLNISDARNVRCLGPNPGRETVKIIGKREEKKKIS